MTENEKSVEDVSRPMYHTKLLGLGNEDLKKLAPTATHQHYKGGLYRLCDGPIESKEINDLCIMVVEHVFPYNKRKFFITEDEFNEKIEESTEPRYRKLLFKTDINRLQMLRCNVCWFSSYPEKVNPNCKACNGTGELTHEQVFGEN